MFARKLTGRCSNGFERDGGKVAHAVHSDATPSRDKALCGAVPGRLSSGWGLPSPSLSVTCTRCAARMNRGREADAIACWPEQWRKDFQEQNELLKEIGEELLSPAEFLQCRYEDLDEKQPQRGHVRKSQAARVHSSSASSAGLSVASSTMPSAVRWCWYGEEDGGQVWTAASGSFFLEVDGASGRCEISEWDAETADIGDVLWEAREPGASVDALQRMTQVALAEMRAAPFVNTAAVNAASNEPRGRQTTHDRRDYTMNTVTKWAKAAAKIDAFIVKQQAELFCEYEDCDQHPEEGSALCAGHFEQDVLGCNERQLRREGVEP